MGDDAQVSEPQGPVMLDLTALVRKPPFRWAILGALLFEFRQVAAAVVALIVTFPIASRLFSAGMERLGITLVLLSIVSAGLAVTARPEGMNPVRFAWLTVRQKAKRMEVDGETAKIYVGLCPVTDFHNGQSFRYARSAVEVKPGAVDDRGALKPEYRDKRTR